MKKPRMNTKLGIKPNREDRTLIFVPAVAIMIPMFILVQKMKLLDTYLVVILAHTTFTLPFTIWIRWAGFSYPFNLTWMPAVTTPCGFTQNGLPVGFRIVAG